MQDLTSSLGPIRRRTESNLPKIKFAWKQLDRMLEMIRHLQPQDTQKQRIGGRVSIHECVNEVLRAMQYEYPLKRITVLKILPHDLPTVEVDYEHLATLFFELIYRARNVLQHTGGVITVDVQDRLYLSSENHRKQRLHIRVKDTGPSIPRHILSDIFDPTATSLAHPVGNRMGLYLVKEIVAHHSGTIRVETSPEGTSFHLVLPLE